MSSLQNACSISRITRLGTAWGGFCAFRFYDAPEIAPVEVFQASVLVGLGSVSSRSTCDKSFDRMQNRLGSPGESTSCNHRCLAWHRSCASHNHSHLDHSAMVSRATRSISIDFVVVYPSQFGAFYERGQWVRSASPRLQHTGRGMHLFCM